MRIRPIMAVVAMHSKDFTDKTELIETAYWWICDMLFLGLLGKSVGALSGNPLMGTITTVTVIAMRPTVIRGAMIMARQLIDELSGRTFLATMATPITYVEWTTATIVISFLQALMRLCLGFMLIFFFFGINVFSLGWAFFVTIPFFILAGWSLGMFTLACAYAIGKRSITQLQVLTWSFLALGGVFSPVENLPPLLQHISWQLPVTYLATGLRAHLLTHASLWPFLIKGLLLTIAHAAIGIALLRWTIARARRSGFTILENR